jgi:transcriptional regulator with XRE-family HTH domain
MIALEDLTNLQKLLEPRGKVSEVCKITGASTGNVSDWKSGRSLPSKGTLNLIAKHFGVSVAYLLDNTGTVSWSSELGECVEPHIAAQRFLLGRGLLNYENEFTEAELADVCGAFEALFSKHKAELLHGRVKEL